MTVQNYSPAIEMSLWLAEANTLDSFRSTPSLPAAVDVVVVGAGIAG